MTEEVIRVEQDEGADVAHLHLNCSHVIDVSLEDERSFSFLGTETECLTCHPTPWFPRSRP
jgi:hypothetical protein